MSWIKSVSEGAILNVRVVPRAGRNQIQGVLGDALKVRLQAPPVEGRANRALVEFLAEQLDISSTRVRLVAGSSSRNKRILVAGVDEVTLRRKLGIGLSSAPPDG